MLLKRTFHARRHRLYGWTRAPAVIAFLAWGGFQLIGATLQVGGFGAVSALAHLGGVACGLLLWIIWRR